MKVILIKCPNNEEDRIPAGHLLSPNELSSNRNGSVTGWLGGGGGWKSPNNPGCCQDNRLLSTKDSKAPLLKTAHTELIDHGEVELVPT